AAKAIGSAGRRRRPCRTALDHFRTLPGDYLSGKPGRLYPWSWRPCPKMIDVLFAIAPHSLLLDIAGPAEAFRLANLHRQLRGLPPRFRLRFAGPVATLPTSVGLGLVDLEP